MIDCDVRPYNAL